MCKIIMDDITIRFSKMCAAKNISISDILKKPSDEAINCLKYLQHDIAHKVVVFDNQFFAYFAVKKLIERLEDLKIDSC